MRREISPTGIANLIGKVLIAAALIVTLSICAFSQDEPQPCPPDKVCISPEAARKALEDSDARKALETEKAVLLQAIEDHKKIAGDLKIELAKITGQLTGEQQSNVQSRAIIELLLKHTKKKCLPFSVCF